MPGRRRVVHPSPPRPRKRPTEPVGKERRNGTYHELQKPSIEMKIVGGELRMGKVERRVGIVEDVDVAIQRLLNGEVVFLHQYGPTVTTVQQKIRIALGITD